MQAAEWRRLRWGLLFISPWIIGFLCFTLYPIVASLFFSFTDFTVVNFHPNWIGLANFKEMFFHDNRFWLSLRNTIAYAVMLISMATVYNIVVALLLNTSIRGRSIYRTIFFLPVLMPIVASALAWLWVLNPQYGMANALLGYVGIKGPLWLASLKTAMLSVVLIAVWATGRPIIIYLAGLQDIPRHLYESAEIDGADALQRAIHITIPLLTPQILFNVCTMLIFSLQSFAEVYIMTSGGPANATLLYSVLLYKRAFQDLDMGYASAMAWLLFVIILILTLLLFRVANRWVVYER